MSDSLEEHRQEFRRTQTDLADSEKREHTQKVLIALVGGSIALCSLAAWPFAIIVAVVTVLWAKFHKSQERTMLAESLAMHASDIERLEGELTDVNTELESMGRVKK